MFDPCKAFDMALKAHEARKPQCRTSSLCSALWRYERQAFYAMEAWQDHQQSPVALEGAMNTCRKLYYWSTYEPRIDA